MELSIRAELDELLTGVETSINTLKSILLLDGIVEDFVTWSIEKKQNNRIVTSQSTLSSAINTYSDFECVAPDNTKEVTIYPGYIVLDQNKVDMLTLNNAVQAVNIAKTNLKLFLKANNKPKKVTLTKGPKVKLNPILFEAYPMKNPTQIFREVKLLNKPVTKAHVTWVRKQRYDRHSLDSATRIAIYNIDKPPAFRFSSAQWRARTELLISKLSSMPISTEIMRIKPAPHTPQVAVKHPGNKQWNKLHGSLPILMLTDGSPVQLTASLTDLYNATLIDEEKLAGLGWKSICSELGFYVKAS